MTQSQTQAVEWADSRIRDAYFLLDEVLQEHNPEGSIFDAVKVARDAAEDADCEIERCRKAVRHA